MIRKIQDDVGELITNDKGKGNEFYNKFVEAAAEQGTKIENYILLKDLLSNSVVMSTTAENEVMTVINDLKSTWE